MQSPVVTAASQNGHWNSADIRRLTVMPWVKLDGNVAFVDPTRGTLRLNTALTSSVMIIRPIMKNKREYSGFL